MQVACLLRVSSRLEEEEELVAVGEGEGEEEPAVARVRAMPGAVYHIEGGGFRAAG